MKNNLLFLVVVPFVLAGCSFTSTPSDVVESTWINVVTGTVESWVVLNISWSVQDTDKTSYSKPIVTMVQPWLQLTTTPLTLKNDTRWISKWAYQTYQSQVSGCNWLGEEWYVEYECKEMRGYDHIYYAPALGIRITYNPWSIMAMDLAGFWDKDPKLLFLSGYTVYASNHQEDFIEYIKKDPNVSPDDIVKTIATPKGCSIIKETEDNMYLHKTKNLITYVLDWESCRNEENGWAYTLYIFSPTEKNYYYRQTFSDGCAPWACSNIDGEQEFFVK